MGGQGTWMVGLQSGEYVLGFRMDPQERLEKVTKEIQAMRTSYLVRPLFGVQFVKETVSAALPLPALLCPSLIRGGTAGQVGARGGGVLGRVPRGGGRGDRLPHRPPRRLRRPPSLPAIDPLEPGLGFPGLLRGGRCWEGRP